MDVVDRVPEGSSNGGAEGRRSVDGGDLRFWKPPWNDEKLPSEDGTLVRRSLVYKRPGWDANERSEPTP